MGKDGFMRPLVWAAVLAGGLASVVLTTTALAQTVRQPSDWQKMYNDVSTQLRAAQDRKSELAADNTKLTAHVAQLQIQADALADRILFLQTFYDGWESFMARNSSILDQWAAFWDEGRPGPRRSFPLLFDPQWPRLQSRN
jgi:hypothetical protein